MLLWIREAAGLILFLGNSLTDIRRQQISLIVTGAMAVFGAVLRFLGDGPPGGLILALTPGITFILLSLASRGGIGMGDGIVLLAAGFYRTFEELLAVVLLAVFLSGAYAAFVFMAKRRGDTRFAFVPFLFLADLIRMLSGG